MSANSDTNTNEAPQYDNEETAEELTEAAQKVEEQKHQQDAEEAAAVQQGRETVANEEQPFSDLPQPEAKTADWRGIELEFDEMGEALVDIVKMENDDDVADYELFEYAIDVFAEKCRHPEADRDYWSRFDMTRDDDLDGLMDLFSRLAGGEDISAEERQQIREFRDE